MTPSISEVFAMGRKAAKGVGLNWGHADEAGRAASWLWYHGVDGIGALAHLLNAHETGCAPENCPLQSGTVLCDDPPDSIREFKQIISPIILLSFTAELAKITENPFELRFGDAIFGASTQGMFCLRGGHSDLADAVIVQADVSGDRLGPAPRRAADPTAWATLERFAHRTYAPATEASRLAGAGAGLSDND